MIDKPLDNAQLTKIIKRLENKTVPEGRSVTVPGIVNFMLYNNYDLPLPAGNITAIRTYTKVADTLADKDKSGLVLTYSYKENVQVTTKALPINEGLSVNKIVVTIPDGVINFCIDTSKIVNVNVTLSFLPVIK